jgi:small subunit ribosomal protein S5
MTTEKIENVEIETSNIKKFTSSSSAKQGQRKNSGAKSGDRGGRNKNGRGGRPERAKPEFEQKTIDVRRVTRVVSGGRRFTFSVALVIGDKKGRVGFGMGKAGDTALAIDKAYKQAQKKMVNLHLTKEGSIPHELSAKYNASYINLMPNKGRGLIAGSSARVVLAMAGVQNITAKIHSGSKNKINNAKVVMKALSEISSPYEKKSRSESSEIESGKTKNSREGRSENSGGRTPRKAFFVKKKVEAELETPKQEIVFEK